MDNSISNFFIDHRPEWLGNLAKFVSYLGQFPIHVVLIILIGVAVRKRTDLVAVGALSALFAYGLNSVLKKGFDRSRPATWRWFEGYHAHGNSLPSGHAVNAGVLGVLMFMWLPERWRWSGVALTLAVMWSRVELGVHWPTDVILGGVIGAGIGLAGQYAAKKFAEMSA